MTVLSALAVVLLLQVGRAGATPVTGGGAADDTDSTFRDWLRELTADALDGPREVASAFVQPQRGPGSRTKRRVGGPEIADLGGTLLDALKVRIGADPQALTILRAHTHRIHPVVPPADPAGVLRRLRAGRLEIPMLPPSLTDLEAFRRSLPRVADQTVGAVLIDLAVTRAGVWWTRRLRDDDVTSVVRTAPDSFERHELKRIGRINRSARDAVDAIVKGATPHQVARALRRTASAHYTEIVASHERLGIDVGLVARARLRARMTLRRWFGSREQGRQLLISALHLGLGWDLAQRGVLNISAGQQQSILDRLEHEATSALRYLAADETLLKGALAGTAEGRHLRNVSRAALAARQVVVGYVPREAALGLGARGFIDMVNRPLAHHIGQERAVRPR